MDQTNQSKINDEEAEDRRTKRINQTDQSKPSENKEVEDPRTNLIDQTAQSEPSDKEVEDRIRNLIAQTDTEEEMEDRITKLEEDRSSAAAQLIETLNLVNDLYTRLHKYKDFNRRLLQKIGHFKISVCNSEKINKESSDGSIDTRDGSVVDAGADHLSSEGWETAEEVEDAAAAELTQVEEEESLDDLFADPDFPISRSFTITAQPQNETNDGPTRCLYHID